MTTVRLSTELETILERLANQRGQTKSEVIRDAIEHLAQDVRTDKGTALDRLRPFIGIADSGGQQLSKQTGKKFRRLLEEKRSASRSG